jgi:hypothetical protein
MAVYGTQFLERIQFFNGQRLFASDLQALEAFNREMRWLHNQSLHQPGVGSGYAVAGNKGDREVTVAPGYALNALGQEIILTEANIEPIPPVADNGAGASVFYYLTVSYPDDTALKPSETRDGICLPVGVVRLREEPVFCWVRLNDDGTQPVDPDLKERVQKGLFIVLARIEVFNCQLKQPVSVEQRRNARPSKQPYIGCGEFTPAAKDWQAEGLGGTTLPFQLDLGTSVMQFPAVRFSTKVDTSAAGFQATPEYTVRLIGDRPHVSANDPPSHYLLDGLIDVATKPAPTPQAFWVDIYPFFWTAVQAGEDKITVDKALFRDWSISWLGIES